MKGGRSRGAASRIAAQRSAASGTPGRFRLNRIAPPRRLAASSFAKVGESPPAPKPPTMSCPTRAGISRSICIVAHTSLGLRKVDGKVDGGGLDRGDGRRLPARGDRCRRDLGAPQGREEVAEVPRADPPQARTRNDRATRKVAEPRR